MKGHHWLQLLQTDQSENISTVFIFNQQGIVKERQIKKLDFYSRYTLMGEIASLNSSHIFGQHNILTF
jgi:hypothetical protein